MHARSLVSLLAAVALIAGACSSESPPSPSASKRPSAADGSQLASIGPGVSGGVPSSPIGTIDPSASPSGDPGASGSPGASPSPKPPKLAGYVRNGKRNDKKIALTFDADMYPFMYQTKDSYHEFDPRVIKLLEDNDVHATIFLNGLYVKAYPDLVSRLAKLPGIELANHTWDHAGFQACNNTTPIQPPLTKTTEITKVADIVKATTGIDVHWFRPPGGCHSTSDLALIQSLGEWAVGWDCYFGDSLGWTGPQEVRNVQQTCQNGSIVVTHLNNTKYHPGIYDALKVLIPWWKANGWEVVNVGELLGRPTPKP